MLDKLMVCLLCTNCAAGNCKWNETRHFKAVRSKEQNLRKRCSAAEEHEDENLQAICGVCLLLSIQAQ